MSVRMVDVSRWAREIVAKRAAIVTAAAAVVNVAVSLGLGPSIGAQTEKGINGVLDILAVIVAVLWARGGVTPADPALQPVSSGGEPLVPVSDLPELTPADVPTQAGDDPPAFPIGNAQTDQYPSDVVD